MIHKRSELNPSVVGVAVAFLVLLALSLANTTWAAPGAQGTIGQPPTATPKLTSTPRGGGGCSDCGPTAVAPTATPLPRLPTTGGGTEDGIGVIAFSLLAVLGAGLVWQGLRLARR